MVAGFEGLSLDEVRSLAKDFDKQASELDDAVRTVTADIHSAYWVGPVAVKFEATWNSVHRVNLTNIEALLHDQANNLRQQAQQQEDTSGDAVGGTGGSISPPILAPLGGGVTADSFDFGEVLREGLGVLESLFAGLADLSGRPLTHLGEVYGGLGVVFGVTAAMGDLAKVVEDPSFANVARSASSAASAARDFLILAGDTTRAVPILGAVSAGISAGLDLNAGLDALSEGRKGEGIWDCVQVGLDVVEGVAGFFPPIGTGISVGLAVAQGLVNIGDSIFHWF